MIKCKVCMDNGEVYDPDINKIIPCPICNPKNEKPNPDIDDLRDKCDVEPHNNS